MSTISDPDDHQEHDHSVAGLCLDGSGRRLEVITKRDTIRLRQAALCRALGLNPETTSSIRVDFDGTGARVSWDGFRKLSADELAKCLEAVRDAVTVPDERGRR